MLLWFRNDLTTHDNPALHYYLQNLPANSTGKAIFFISERQWQAHDWSAIKIDFIKRHAYALVAQLADLNMQLSIVAVDDFSAQVDYLCKYCAQENIQQIIANSELEFNEQQRDQQLIAQGMNLTLFESDVIVPKGKVLTQSDTMFKVFTPFKKAWLNYVRNHGFQYLGKPEKSLGKPEKSLGKPEQTSHNIIHTDHCIDNPIDNSTDSANEQEHSKKWPLATRYEKQVLAKFIADKLENYQQLRDIPSIKATSAISPYLAAGVISPRYVLRILLNKHPDLLYATDSPAFTWLNEIIWREFYRHLIFHYPSLCKHQCFQEKYRQTVWYNDPQLFAAWCQGKTGYPLVDAAMRQLNQTGWMHNRLRMVVASFLTKHLLIDWRWGEKYFMQHLIDGDLAANNGGWQWAASTGCDAQPYFRVFNPIRQSERFDAKGTFIRKFLPELKDLPDKQIHFPHDYIKKQQLNIYWPAIVDHKEARLKAIAFYK